MLGVLLNFLNCSPPFKLFAVPTWARRSLLLNKGLPQPCKVFTANTIGYLPSVSGYNA